MFSEKTKYNEHQKALQDAVMNTLELVKIACKSTNITLEYVRTITETPQAVQADVNKLLEQGKQIYEIPTFYKINVH